MVVRLLEIRQASTLRECQSMTAKRWRRPRAIWMYEISAHHT